MKKFYLTKKFICEYSISDLDVDLRESFGFHEDEHEDFVEIEKGYRFRGPDTEPINIDELIDLLVERKKRGSTHVSLDYHEDHIGYEMAFFEIYESTDAEISLYEDEMKKKATDRQNRKRADLERQLRDLDDDVAIPGYNH
jgi:hypothetical protein